jgi:hypothetical protein
MGVLPELYAATTKLSKNARIFCLWVREWIQSNVAGISSNSSTNRADAKKWTTVHATRTAVLPRREETNRSVGRTGASWRSEQTETRNAILLENARRIQI